MTISLLLCWSELTVSYMFFHKYIINILYEIVGIYLSPRMTLDFLC